MPNPTLRFKQDNGIDYLDYKETALSSIAERITRKNKDNESDVPLTIASLYGLVDQRDYFNRTVASKDMSGYYLLKRGEFAYNKSYSVGYDFGSIKRLDKYDKGALSTLYICFAIDDSVDSEYMTYYFDSQKWTKEVSVRCAEGARNHGLLNISASDFFDIMMTLPADVDEQRKIAALLTEVDNLISASADEVEALKSFKQGMLQKMFPKAGEKAPEIRFPGFTGDWEEKMLGDIGRVAMCKRVFKDQTSASGEIPFYKIGTFGGTPDAFISRELFEEYKEKYSYPEKGDILISASGSIGRTVEFTGKDEYFQDSNIVWLMHDNSITNRFLKHLYEVIKWSGIEGTTIKRLYNDIILNTKVLIPSTQEQGEIAAMLDGIDNLITLHQRELDGYKQLKKGLLQQMFV